MKTRKTEGKSKVSPIATILLSVFGAVTSSGVCSIVLYLIQRKDKKKVEYDERITRICNMLLGLGHDRIIYLGGEYLERGCITQDEYKNLHDYLFQPYKALGGNGTAEKIMNEVEKLPLCKDVCNTKEEQ